MVLTPESFQMNCTCGRPHPVLLQKAVIAPGALYGLNDLLAERGAPGPVEAVYDANTHAATAGRRPKADAEVVLDPAGLHADEHGVAALEAKLGAPGTLLAVGSGTIHDITRYVAARRGVPFVSVPTAASVDGLVSAVAAMTWNGFKVTLKAVAPTLLVADLDVIAAAPWRLTQSGVGDVLGKYVALADWRIAHRLSGEYYCGGVAALTGRAVDEVAAHSARLQSAAAGERLAAYASLTKALVLSGVAMQLAGSSRPASSAEHHISHLLELGLGWIGRNHAMHGEKVGVGTVLCAAEYHRWARLDAAQFAARGLAQKLAAYTSPGAGELRPGFGRLTPCVLDENQDDCLLAVPPGAAEENWDYVRRQLLSVPSAETLAGLLAGLGASRGLPDIGVDPALLPRLLYWAPCVRNRLSFLRLTRPLASPPGRE